MKIAHVGLGNMGKTVQRIANARGHQSVAEICDADGIDRGLSLDSDVSIECTVPDSCLDNVRRLCEAGQNIVIVTTGWYEQMEEVKTLVENSGNRVIWSSNFSVGVYLYFRLVEAGAKLINQADEYDVWGTEIHHRHKVDSPSGTAKTLEDILIKNIFRKDSVIEEKLDRKIESNEIHFSSTRGGDVNFEHVIGFDSSADVIKVSHSARNRDGYGLGTVKAAEWLVKQDPGFYGMDDFMEKIMGGI